VKWVAGEPMEAALKSVKQSLAVHSDAVELSPGNAALLRGCQNLGYHAEIAPQQGYQPNAIDGGLCAFGYKGGERQGMTGSALKDAAGTGNFQYLTDAFVDHVVVKDGKATGVVGSVAGRPLCVSAKMVVCAAGSLQTPLLLVRSGLRNAHIGRNLRLHPVSVMRGIFKERMACWEGAPMTTVSRVAENLDGSGYGCKIEVPCLHPLLIGAGIPWRGSNADFKRAHLLMDRTLALIVLTRDSGSGKVNSDERNWPRVNYSLAPQDRRHMKDGLVHAAKILVAAGATEIYWDDPALPAYHVTSAGVEDPGFQDWLQQLLSLNPETLLSAHQMGTCRMASSAKQGALRPSGESWEVNNLFVSDCSTFPTASGSNPMMTCAALAEVVAQEVVQRLVRGSARPRL